mmetsp:Transcript_25149/g.64978  ORF Transcript_25149/g.64978 Transcript_25149/m.64978 type:complete len:165 (-) Transcript_25149:562-1056(-)
MARTSWDLHAGPCISCVLMGHTGAPSVTDALRSAGANKAPLRRSNMDVSGSDIERSAGGGSNGGLGGARCIGEAGGNASSLRTGRTTDMSPGGEAVRAGTLCGADAVAAASSASPASRVEANFVSRSSCSARWIARRAQTRQTSITIVGAASANANATGEGETQ